MMLTLPIAKKWFDMILAEDPKQRKLDEYREWNEYWGKRFAKVLGFHDMPMMDEFLKRRAQMGKQSDPFQVRYRNGYSGNSPSFKAKVSLSIGKGREEWGAETGKEYYRLHIIDIQDIRNYKTYNIYKTYRYRSTIALARMQNEDTHNKRFKELVGKCRHDRSSADKVTVGSGQSDI